MKRTYTKALQIISMMNASKIGAVVECLDYANIPTTKKNTLSSNWAVKLKTMSEKTFQSLQHHFPQVMISDQALAVLEGLVDGKVGENDICDDGISLLETYAEHKLEMRFLNYPNQ